MPALARLARPLTLAASLAALAWPSAPRASHTFAAGSLIIPAQAEYQTDCGMTSAYGLVYSILYKNPALKAAGKKAVTIYWIIEPRKQSHHRCDTGTENLPDYSKFNDDDGCDLAIQSAAGQPVARLKADNTEEAPFKVFRTSYDKAKGAVYRTPAGITTPDTTVSCSDESVISRAPCGGKATKVMKYSGGFWAIDAIDRGTVLDLLTKDAMVSLWRQNEPGCKSIPVATTGSHFTQIHSARIGFTAPVARMINVKPPLIALLDAGAVTILQDYLRNAGLASLTGAGGTPVSHGIIYDALNPVTDFVSTPTYPYGAVNMPDPVDATKNFYQVMWAPHWVASNQSTLPVDGDPGDDVVGDGAWTHGGDDPVTNALKNIAAFGDAGSGVFAECASIESLEGSYKPIDPGCQPNTDLLCECTDSSATPACSPFGSWVPTSCPSGYTSTCGACYSCPVDYSLDWSSCDAIKCIPTLSAACATGFTYACSGCYQCDSGWSLDTTNCLVRCTKGKASKPPHTDPVNTAPVSQQPLSCPSAGYTQVCQAAALDIDVPGQAETRFQTTNRLVKNGLGNSFAGPDCTDGQYTQAGSTYAQPPISGDCMDYHPSTGGPANLFSQKGNFNYTGTTGHIHQYYPPSSVGSFYRPGTLFFATSRNKSDATRDGWDFTTARYKDNDFEKGMTVYLAGHSYQNDVAGNRIVLNTMLNLGFSLVGVELARSEPVGYVVRHYDKSGNAVVDAELVFQGTYMQKPPPGPYQDWLNYNVALPQGWKFPYIDGHLYAHNLTAISSTKQDFNTNSIWDAATRLPLPGDRTMFTVLGGRGRAGWSRLDVKHTQTDPGSCKSSRTDALGQPICDLSWELAACATAGVTQTQLQAGDPAGKIDGTLGMFVQQVRGHCSAHDKTSGAPIHEPNDLQCDNLKSQKNRAKLGGIDHSSPAVVGPSRYIPDEKRGSVTIPWSTRPVVAYAGGRDGMLHAFYVTGDVSWSAEGAAMPAGVQAGQELWAMVPPGQLCGLATNGAMVDATINVIDAFGNFPRDANGDGVFDYGDAAEKPTGIRSWRTVLIASVGEGGSELFALDVTNPLRPALLWHLSGPNNMDDQFFDAVSNTWKPMDTANPATYAYKWYNWDDGNAATTYIPTPYNTTSQAILDQVKTGRYAFRNLGQAFGTAVGMLWQGNAFRYVTWVTTSSANWADPVAPLGYKGIETYAIDLASGEKIWQWQNRYTRQNAAGNVIADNAIPGRPALLDVNGDGAVDRVYVGDIEGHMWELTAPDGKNYNYLQDAASKAYVSLPFFGTPAMTGTGADATILADFGVTGTTSLAQQPLTSPIGIGRMLSVPADVEPYLKDRMAVAQGTMGVDWSIVPFEPGHVFILPAYPEKMVVAYKDPITGATVQKTVDTRERNIDLAAKPELRLQGVLLPVADWDIQLALGERVFGMPKIVGNDIIINTSYGGFSGDISDTYLDLGSTLRISTTGGTETLESIGKAFGGALVMDGSVVVTSASGMARATPARAIQGSTQTNPRNRYTPTNFNAWEQLPAEKIQ